MKIEEKCFLILSIRNVSFDKAKRQSLYKKNVNRKCGIILVNEVNIFKDILEYLKPSMLLESILII